MNNIHDYDIFEEKREIFILDGSEGIDAQVANRFLKNLRILEASNKPITIYINSEGGDCISGIMIYDAIRRSRCDTTIIMTGQTCSIAAVIAQSADYRYICPGTLFMTHIGTIEIERITVQQLDAYSDSDKRYRQFMVDIFANKCAEGPFFKEKKYNKKKIKSYLLYKWNRLTDWYLSPEDVVKYGFADEILGVTYEEKSSMGRNHSGK